MKKSDTFQTPVKIPPQEQPRTAERDEKIIKMYNSGSYSYTSLSRIFLITSQRIGQIIKKGKHEKA